MEKIKKSIVASCKREIDMANYYIGLYEFKKTRIILPEDIAKNDLKIQQMKDAIKSNRDALELVKEYNKTI